MKTLNICLAIVVAVFTLHIIFWFFMESGCQQLHDVADCEWVLVPTKSE